MTAKRVRTDLRLPMPLNQSLADMAEQQGISKNALMLQILWDYIEKKGA